MANEFLDQNGLKMVWDKAKTDFAPMTHTHDDYVTKEEGKELFTSEEREKLSNIENNAQVNKIESISLNNVPQSVNNKNVNLNIDLSPYATKEALSDLEEEFDDKIAGLDLEFGYDDLTEEQKADLRKGLSSINAQYTSTFNVSELTHRIPIGIPEYSHGMDILHVYINGMRLIEGTDYTNDGTHISLIKPLNVIGQVHIAVTKAISLSDKEWESLQPEEIEAITNLEIDKLMEL